MKRREFLGLAGIGLASPAYSNMVSIFGEFVSEDKNIGHIALDLETEMGATVKDHERLDEMIERAKRAVVKKENYPSFEVPGVLMQLHKALDANDVRDEYPNMFHESLRSRTFDCDMRTIAYLAMGEELGLPLHAVRSKGHTFVRWDEDGKHNVLIPSENKGDINWETTAPITETDMKYIKDHKIPDVSIANGVYLRTLSKKETIGMLYFNRGTTKFDRGNYEGAEKDHNEAIERNPRDPEAHHNRGCARNKLEKYREALSDFKKATELDPSRGDSFTGIGNMENMLKDYRSAIIAYSKAISINPKDEFAYFGRAYSKQQLKYYKGAAEDKKMFERLKR